MYWIRKYEMMVFRYDKKDIGELRNMDYAEYQMTYHWYCLKRAVRKFFGNVCYDCGKWGWIYKLQLHHLSYERRGCERITDCRLLCKGCHGKRHKKVG